MLRCITSPILRRLLVEHALEKAARSLKLQMHIMTPVCCAEITPSEDLDFFQCGGAKFKGMELQSLKVYEYDGTSRETPNSHQNEKDSLSKSCPVSVSAFLKQTSFIIGGISINREEVIKYVANKLGGAHYDSKRKIDEKAPKVSLEHKFALLGQHTIKNGLWQTRIPFIIDCLV